MKRIIVFLSIFVLLFVTFSCKDNLFNFDLHNIEAEGEWGIPVLDAQIDVDKMLKGLNQPQFLGIGENGTVKFMMDLDFPDILSMNHLVKLGTKNFDSESSILLPAQAQNFLIPQLLTINLNTEDIRIKEADMKTGYLTMEFDFSDVSSYDITITSNNITNAQGNPISLTFNNFQKQHDINLADCKVTPNNDGSIVFSGTVNLNSPNEIYDVNYKCHISVSQFSFYNITIEPFSAKTENLNQTIPVLLDFDKFNIEKLKIDEPTFTIWGKNGICPAIGTLNTLSYYERNGHQVPLISSPINLDFPISDEYTPLTTFTLSKLEYKSGYDSLHLAASLTLNPNGYTSGEFHLNETSSVSLKVHCEMASNISIDNAVYEDTTDNIIHNSFDFSRINFIDKLTLRVVFTNTLPFDILANLNFLNTETSERISINFNETNIPGCYNGQPVISQPIYIEISAEDAKKIIKADKIIQSYTIDTRNNDVELTKSQYIKANIGAKIKYSEIEL